ncbi:hypothetical protein FF1_017638 [Malus domestica]
MNVSHGSAHTVEDVPTTEGAGPNSLRVQMKDFPSMPGTLGSLVLHFAQFFFFAAALIVVATTSDFPSVTAFWWRRQWRDKGGREGQGSEELGSGVAKGRLEGGNGGSYGGEGRELGVLEGRQLGEEVGMVGEDLGAERREGEALIDNEVLLLLECGWHHRQPPPDVNVSIASCGWLGPGSRGFAGSHVKPPPRLWSQCFWCHERE